LNPFSFYHLLAPPSLFSCLFLSFPDLQLFASDFSTGSGFAVLFFFHLAPSHYPHPLPLSLLCPPFPSLTLVRFFYFFYLFSTARVLESFFSPVLTLLPPSLLRSFRWSPPFYFLLSPSFFRLKPLSIFSFLHFYPFSLFVFFPLRRHLPYFFKTAFTKGWLLRRSFFFFPTLPVEFPPLFVIYPFP